MFILGLTGSIGMGKSTAAAMFRRLGVPLHDADAAVHRLMDHNGAAVAAIAALFPKAVQSGRVNRKELGDEVLGKPEKLRQLEQILHPLVRREMQAFLARQALLRRKLVVLDIPLLYETGGDGFCDAVLVVSCPGFLQQQRVLKRPGMTREKFNSIRNKQISDLEKRARADFVVPTGLGKRLTLRSIRNLVALSYNGAQTGSKIPEGLPEQKQRKFLPYLSKSIRLQR
ncbi:dephospho-CoA kinase [Kiloniella laminariae]|uniref:Dephospho-CoA kinase n=1 Tax=Kiloniella laminariae TaxID=454162 RepID=A0ABT4LJA3_9PROT|nr:dephospho-CoA kinase [Kiloniella laminariae]MCZ4281185.1 dephospho-CoA kinase [Kiloniella laminariae]